MTSLDCILTRRRLSRYLDAELSDRKACRTERHLADCPGCQRELDELVETVRFLGRGRTVTPPADAWMPIEQRLTMSGVKGFAEGQAVHWSPRSAHRSGRRHLVPAAVLVAIMAAGVPFAARYLTPEPVLAHEIDVETLLTDLAGDRLQNGVFWRAYRAVRVDGSRAAHACPSGRSPAPEVPFGFGLESIMVIRTDCCEGLLLRYRDGARVITVVQIADHHPIASAAASPETLRQGMETMEVYRDGGVSGVVAAGTPVNVLVAGREEVEVLAQVASFLHTRAEAALSSARH